MDYDYTNKLPDKEIPHCNNPNGECKICNNPKTRFVNPKDYLNRFTEEYTNADFKHKGERVQKKKEDELEAYQRNNKRNSDVFSITKALNRIHDLEALRFNGEQLSPEDIMIQREELKEILSNPEVIKKAIEDKNVKKLVDELTDKLSDLDVMAKELYQPKDES